MAGYRAPRSISGSSSRSQRDVRRRGASRDRRRARPILRTGRRDAGGLAPLQGNTAGAGARFAAAFAQLDDGEGSGKRSENIVLVDDGFDCGGVRCGPSRTWRRRRGPSCRQGAETSGSQRLAHEPLGRGSSVCRVTNVPASSSGAKAGAKGLTRRDADDADPRENASRSASGGWKTVRDGLPGAKRQATVSRRLNRRFPVRSTTSSTPF